MNYNKEPISCAVCKNLALAYFNNRPLCRECIFTAVTSCDDPVSAVMGIKPLYSELIKGISKCKSKSDSKPTSIPNHQIIKFFSL